MRKLLTIEVTLLPNGQTSAHIDATVDVYTAIGFLEEAKKQILESSKMRATAPSLTLPSLSPKTF